MAPVGAALVGTGIFARDVYKTAFKTRAGEVELRAVWSRTADSARAYVEELFPGGATAALSGEEGLQAIIADPAIELVVVVLPVQPSLPIVERLLSAGKAVVQEKPVGPSVEEAAAAIARYRAAVASAPSPASTPVWMFAENYRWEAVFLAAARRVSAGVLGRIIKLDLVADLPMDSRNRYYGSSWRRDTDQCPGGFFTDSSVHFVAALRMLAASAGAGEATSVSAHAVQVKPDLSFPDSVVGVATFASGVPASISISLAAHQVRWSLSVVGSEGSLEVSRGGWGGSRGEYTLNIKTSGPLPEGAQPASESDPTWQRVAFPFSGCPDEFAEFVGTTRELRHGSSSSSSAAGGGGSSGAAAAAVVPGPEAASSPEQGARDLALIEALLSSAAEKGKPVAVRQL
ncbi:hypothetical protein HYH02_005898 [Chlamydomonas schloesseri]|uniref:Gfo/Idh/MocA-like oxidoreductase N-terminal domain-containing protein n=1 Tax=Chlamydomonas schloesseri TaxID=2026947 RepID=A0A836B6K2_9CHLO|nr:hypothetical protein HYH02_005898 [Chlamydomonas schloesseri]|eukprot:KAG2449151.1 hypothetical protein HYH02_005898 [Chlamydomonas schloesseri]